MTAARLATAADIGQVCRTLSRAFAADPVVRWFIPGDDEYEENHQAFFGGIVRRWLATASLWCTDDVVAVAGWNPPGRPVVELDDPGPPMEHPEWRLERFKVFGEILGAHTPAELHWHLNMIGTHPDWQRQGVAGALMAAGFEIAERDGLPCYLETETVGNVAYYRHHGFEVRSEWDVPLDGPHMWGMLRPTR